MIKVEKKTEVVVRATDGKVINVGDKVHFVASGKVCVGTYKGLGKRGSLQFEGLAELKPYSFAVAPSSICEIYKLGVE